MNRLFGYSYLAVIYLFFYLPIIVLVTYSFNASSYSLLWHGFTLKWYKQLIMDAELLRVALHSLCISLLAATIATILGVLTATCFAYYTFLGKKLLHSLTFILIISPEIVLAIALLMLFSILHIPLGFWTLLLAHIAFCTPFATVIVCSRTAGLDNNTLEAAKDLGADDWTVFRRILMPLLMPAIIAGWLLSFTLSLDDVIISFFVSGPNFQILPLYLYGLLRLGLNPEINALCAVMCGYTLLLVLVAQLLLRKKY